MGELAGQRSVAGDVSGVVVMKDSIVDHDSGDEHQEPICRRDEIEHDMPDQYPPGYAAHVCGCAKCKEDDS